MTSRRVVHGVFQLASAVSNAYLLDGGVGLVLVDTGMRGRADELRREVDHAGRAAARDLAAIAITHAHADHAGSLARLVETFHVPVVAGALEAPAIRAGGLPPPPIPNGLLGRFMSRVSQRVEVDAGRVDLEVDDGDGIPGAPALRAIHTPGHTPGHTSYLWSEEGGVLFAGDVAVNVLGLREAFVHSDRAQARETLARLATLDFEVAVFGHGPPITGRAVARFRKLVERFAR
ncbi:MAG TPA: MBL fold metallo-hydrolase [Candidatus Limnocylindrales bacterium]|nr:MBL fold metallo-hydrolase [Candidatus Limnocylindrales bacterium]